MSDLVTDTGATISDCGKYRYDLWRLWDADKPTLTFIMLNPSTADGLDDDPTVKRCTKRAIKLGYGQLRIANLMAYRATNPDDLRPLERNVSFGPDNKKHLLHALREAGTVICGWGKNGDLGPVAWLTTQARHMGVPLYVLRTNKDGSPEHPLYIPYSVRPTWWAGADAGSKGMEL